MNFYYLLLIDASGSRAAAQSRIKTTWGKGVLLGSLVLLYLIQRAFSNIFFFFLQ